MASSLESIIRDLSNGEIIGPDVERPVGMTFYDLCNAIALRVARDFDARRMSYSVGDGIMNSLWASITATMREEKAGTDWPEVNVALAVFDAFDEGEYTRSDDERDPVEAFTIPMIRELLDRLAGQDT